MAEKPAPTSEFTVTVKMWIEYAGVITLRARSQEEADARALEEFRTHAERAFDAGEQMRLPSPWREHVEDFRPAWVETRDG
jgi:hypothetical protein